MRDIEKLFQECMERGTKYFLKHKHARPHIINFNSEMLKYFGKENTKLIERVYYRLCADIPTIKLFGFDFEQFKNKLGYINDSKEIQKIYKTEKNKAEEFLKSLVTFKAEYHDNDEQVYRDNIDDDWLEIHGYSKKYSRTIEDYAEGWYNYYMEGVENKILVDVFAYEFKGEYTSLSITESRDAKMVIDKIEEEINNFLSDITRTYLANVTLPSTGTSEKISIIGKKVDIVRIFEAMLKAGIISSKTEIKQIAQLFFTDPIDISSFEKNYNATAHRLKDQASLSTSKNLNHFIKLLSERLRQQDVDDLITHLEKLKPIR